MRRTSSTSFYKSFLLLGKNLSKIIRGVLDHRSYPPAALHKFIGVPN
jgi:hypothetical protein